MGVGIRMHMFCLEYCAAIIGPALRPQVRLWSNCFVVRLLPDKCRTVEWQQRRVKRETVKSVNCFSHLPEQCRLEWQQRLHHSGYVRTYLSQFQSHVTRELATHTLWCRV